MTFFTESGKLIETIWNEQVTRHFIFTTKCAFMLFLVPSRFFLIVLRNDLVYSNQCTSLVNWAHELRQQKNIVCFAWNFYRILGTKSDQLIPRLGSQLKKSQNVFNPKCTWNMEIHVVYRLQEKEFLNATEWAKHIFLNFVVPCYYFSPRKMSLFVLILNPNLIVISSGFPEKKSLVLITSL